MASGIGTIDEFSFLTENGVIGGNVNANGDYSSTPVNFVFECPAIKYGRRVERVNIARMIIHYEDTGAFDADKYGNNITITNGVEIRQEKIGYTIDMTAGRPVQTNAHWEEMTRQTHLSEYGTGNNFLTIEWNFEEGGREVLLIPGEKIVVFLSDDFSGLVEQLFKIQGEYTFK